VLPRAPHLRGTLPTAAAAEYHVAVAQDLTLRIQLLDLEQVQRLILWARAVTDLLSFLHDHADYSDMGTLKLGAEKAVADLEKLLADWKLTPPNKPT